MTTSQKVHLLRCAASSVIAWLRSAKPAYMQVRLIPSYLRVLHLKLFTLSSDFLTFYETI
jgi:hypothetical protein